MVLVAFGRDSWLQPPRVWRRRLVFNEEEVRCDPTQAGNAALLPAVLSEHAHDAADANTLMTPRMLTYS